MNIFITDKCPTKSAKALPIILVNKMLTESMQLLSVAHFVLDGQQKGMKPTHQGHPSAKWVRESVWNYLWLLEHTLALAECWKEHTGKIHGSLAYIDELMIPPVNIPNIPQTDFVIAAPDQFKLTAVFSGVEQGYMDYLNWKFKDWATRSDKRQIFVEWIGGRIPSWIDVDLLEIIENVKNPLDNLALAA